MADNNITGFKKLIRYAENLAEYEQGIADGIIDENVFVIVLAEKCAKFKGQTFDWSGGGLSFDDELSDTSENAVQNKTVTAALATKQDTIDDLKTIRSGAALGATALQEHQDISHLATKEEVETVVLDNEEVTAYAFADIAATYSSLNDKVRLDYATKAEVNAIKDMFLNEIVDNEEVVAKALSLLEARLSIIETLT